MVWHHGHFQKMKNAAAEKENCQDVQSTNNSPYQNRKASERALKRLAHSLTQSPQKKPFVLVKMAKEVGLTFRGQPSCQSQKGLSKVTVKLYKLLLKRQLSQIITIKTFHGKTLEEKIVLLFTN